MCVCFVKGVFLEFPAYQNRHLCTTAVKRVSKKHGHDAWKQQKCEFDVGILSASNVFNGSKSFAFVVGALLLLHLVLWFLNHVAIQCERKGPKRVG